MEGARRVRAPHGVTGRRSSTPACPGGPSMSWGIGPRRCGRIGPATAAASSPASGPSGEASDDELRALVAELRAQGTTTMEVKSGYGLTVGDEARTLRLAREVTAETTFLGAHIVPPEYAGRADAYVDLVTGPMLAACRRHLPQLSFVYAGKLRSSGQTASLSCNVPSHTEESCVQNYPYNGCAAHRGGSTLRYACGYAKH